MTEGVDERGENRVRTVFGRGVIEYEDERLAVSSITASLDPDLNVVLVPVVTIGRFVTEIVLVGGLEVSGAGFIGRLTSGQSLRIRPVISEDYAWLLEHPLPGLSDEQISLALAAYEADARVDGDEGPWERASRHPGDAIERLELVLDAPEGKAIGLQFTVKPPWMEATEGHENVLSVWRTAGTWSARPDDVRGGTVARVDPSMTAAVLAAIDGGRTITSAAAELASWPAEATIVGNDPFAGSVRTGMPDVFSSEIQALLDRADLAGVDDSDTRFLRLVMDVDHQLATRDSAEWAWTGQVFNAMTALSTQLGACTKPIGVLFALCSGFHDYGLMAMMAVSVTIHGEARVSLFPELSPAGLTLVGWAFKERGGDWPDFPNDPDLVVDASDMLGHLEADIAESLAASVLSPDGMRWWARAGDRAHRRTADADDVMFLGGFAAALTPTLFTISPVARVDYDSYLAQHRRSQLSVDDWRGFIADGHSMGLFSG